MTKVCAKCGKKIGMLSDIPLELTNSCILCSECSSPISGKIGKLYHMDSKEAFEISARALMEDSTLFYNQEIVDAVKQKISEIYDKCAANPSSSSSSHTILENLASKQMLTTGFDFNGYNIKSYLGVVSGEVVLGTGFLSEFSASFSDFFGSKSGAFACKLEEAKDAALKGLAQHSAERGGNAVIGIDFDYITFSSNMIGVVANGTSVIVEKISI